MSTEEPVCGALFHEERETLRQAAALMNGRYLHRETNDFIRQKVDAYLAREAERQFYGFDMEKMGHERARQRASK